MICDLAPTPGVRQRDLHPAALGLLTLLLLGCPVLAVDFTWLGTTSSDFSLGSNWSGGVAPSPTGGGASSPQTWRITVQNNGSNTLIYSAAQGHTVFSGGGSNRALFLGNSNNASMSITGGIFESTSTGADAMVNGANVTALLSIDGGTYRKITGTGSASTFGVFYAGSGLSKGTLDINSGSFEVTTLDLQNSTATSTQAAGVYESTVNLDGGTLSVGTIVRTATSTGIDAVLNFNGGTLQARADSTTFLAALSQFTANVQAGGAKIDTQNYNITIAAPLVHDTALGTTVDGGLTKTGTGILTLSGASTYTGDTFIKNGRLALGAGSDRLPTGTTVTLGDGSTNDSAVLKLDSRSQTLAGLLTAGTGTGNSVVNGNATAATLTLNIAVSNTFTGLLGGTGTNENNFGLTKTGAGTLTLSGTNTYTGATSIQAGTLKAGAAGGGTVFGVNSAVTLANNAGAVLDLNNFNQTIASLAGGGATGGNVSLGSATLTVGGTNASTTFAGVISGLGGGVTKTGTGTFTLSGVNTYTGLTTVSAGILSVAGNSALGEVAGKTNVASGGTLSLATGIKVTGETVGIAGAGANSMGALQTVAGGAAEWAGGVTIEAASARVGALAGGVLTLSGSIQNGASNTLAISTESGTGTVIISGTSNTYTGATQIIRGILKLGATNALPTGITLDIDSLASALVTEDATFDLNGFNQTVGALQRTGGALGTGGSFITNNGATASTLTVTSGTTSYNGLIQNGTGVVNLTVASSGTLTLLNANTYTGTTTVSAGTLLLNGATASLASTSFLLNGGSFTLDNTGAGNNNTNRLADTADITFKGGSFIYKGSDQAATNSSETVHDLTVSGGAKTLSVVFGGTNSATLTANQLTRPAQGGVLLVNGTNLGADSTSTSSVARVLLTTAPELVGGTDALSTGINAGAKNTKIVPFLLGEATAASGGAGTATGTANTFMTYNETTGLRPLNLTDEFALNTITSGANTRLTTTTNTGTSTTINSLILEGASATISSGQTLTVASGAILLASGSGIGISGGTLAFGAHEGLVTINSTGNTSISSVITGSAGLTYSGTGTLVLAAQQNTYSGDTVLQVATVILQSNSTGAAGSPTSGPFGKGTVIFNGSSIRATSSYAITFGNNVQLKADTTILSSGSTDRTLTFTGDVTLAGGNRTITQSSAANTVFSGSIGDGGSNLGLTIAGSGQSAVVLSGSNTYTGPTQVNGSTLQVGSNGSGTTGTGAVTVASGATLAGSGSVQGATVMNSGSVLQPGDVTTGGTASTTVTSNNTLTFTAANTALTVNDGAQIRLGISSPTIAANVISYSGGAFHYNGHDYSNAQALFSNEAGALSTWNTAPSSTGNHDFINLTGASSTLSIGNRAGGAWGQGSVVVNGGLGTVALGQVINLIDWNGAAITGNFDVGGMTFVDASGNAIAGDLDLVALGAGFGWDVSAFQSYGIIVVVPEPGRACLLLFGLLGFVLRRRR